MSKKTQTEKKSKVQNSKQKNSTLSKKIFNDKVSNQPQRAEYEGASYIQSHSTDTCEVCKKPITEKRVLALGKSYHLEHFACSLCKKQLSNQFLEKDGKIYCEEDYHTLFSPKCAKCRLSIVDKCLAAMDKMWHPEHFRCEKCGKEIGRNIQYHERDGKAYCHEDYLEMFAENCVKCGQPVEEQYISALGKTWHLEHFQCEKCGSVLNKESEFIEKDGKPYCKNDYIELFVPKCHKCKEPIMEKYILVKDVHWHPDCFKYKN